MSIFLSSKTWVRIRIWNTGFTSLSVAAIHNSKKRADSPDQAESSKKTTEEDEPTSELAVANYLYLLLGEGMEYRIVVLKWQANMIMHTLYRYVN